MIRHILVRLARHGPPLLAGGIFLGVLFPGLATLLRPALPALVFVLAAAAMVRTEWRDVAQHVRRPGRIGFALAWGLLASPTVTALAVLSLDLPAGLAEAVVIWSASPALISSPALAFLLGLDGSLALIMVVGGSLLMPFTLPPLVLGLVGVRLEIGILALCLRLVLFIAGAAALAGIVRAILGAPRIARLAGEINGVNVVLLVLFAIAVMDGVDDIALSRPGELALYAGTAFGAALVHQLIGTLVFLWAGRPSAFTIGMVCGNRNMASVWASLGSLATPELTLYLAVVQLPIYVLPVLLRPVYRRLVAKTADHRRVIEPPRRVDGRRASQ
jgi:BASS family bile acid:Na+ symporter